MSARVWRTRRRKKLDRLLDALSDAKWEREEPARLAAEMEHRERGFDQLHRMRTRCRANLYYPGEREAVFMDVPTNAELREFHARICEEALTPIEPETDNEQ